jgi:hypothetical protein
MCKIKFFTIFKINFISSEFYKRRKLEKNM